MTEFIQSDISPINSIYTEYVYINYDWDISSLALTHSFTGLSVIGYFTDFGNGGFYKFDIGSASMDYDLSVRGGDDTNISESGIGFGLGVGYSWYFEQLKKSRVFASFNVAVRNIDMTDSTVPILEDFESYSKSSLNLGFIF